MCSPRPLCALLCALLSAVLAFPASAQERYWQDTPSGQDGGGLDLESRNFRLQLVTELGLLDVLSHKIQQDTDGTYFDYTSPSGGQRTFELFWRISAEALMNKRHRLIFLYQPLRFDKRTRLNEALTVDDITFAAGTTMDLTYGFDFYRLIYSYDLIADPKEEFSVGGGFQMRNAIIAFTPVNGSEGRVSQNLGPVPLIHLRWKKPLGQAWWFGAEADGFYANLPVANGGTENIEGLIADVNLRLGRRLGTGLEAFLNLRYLGGGAEGTSDSDAQEGPGDGFTRNWLHTATVSLGFVFEPAALLP